MNSMHSLITRLGASFLSVVTLMFVACEKRAADSAANPASGGKSSAPLPAGLFVAEQPAGAVGVIAARASAKAGDRVVLLGRIGGSRSPFVSNHAIFTIIDPSLKSCVETGDEDHCPRPWDYCCEERKSLTAGLASIEVRDAQDKPLAISLERDGTLKPLMLVAVEGTWQATDGGALLVRADHIHKVTNDPLAKYIK
ncbi:MAG: hypothetical protein EXS17_08715 [Phycisphaerales bacterium]|nr:hypothetical protein [Phycisphaerales bacterium]